MNYVMSCNRKNIREGLGEKFQLADMLIKPVQRIMKYKLLFKVEFCNKNIKGTRLAY